MTLQEFRGVCEAKPFHPFVIHLADGREIPVHHQEFLITVPSGRTAIVVQPDDTVNIVDLLLVTDLELKPTKNGKRPRRRRGA